MNGVRVARPLVSLPMPLRASIGLVLSLVQHPHSVLGRRASLIVAVTQVPPQVL